MSHSLPINISGPKEWTHYARRHGVDKLTIHELAQYNSASKIQPKQYLALRTIWTFQKAADFNPQDWRLEGVDMARQTLHGMPYWNEFIAKVDTKSDLPNILPVSSELGIFAITWYLQQLIVARAHPSPDHEESPPPSPPRTRGRARLEEVGNVPAKPLTSTGLDSLTQTTGSRSFQDDDPMGDTSTDEEDDQSEEPEDDKHADPDYVDAEDEDNESQGGSYPPVSDETMVAMYLVSFANAVTMCHRGIKSHWLAERVRFQFGYLEDERFVQLYEARTDGRLSARHNKETNVIIEVKPGMRNTTGRTRMQETAEMAAWIQDKDKPDDLAKASKFQRFQRFLLSQDRHQVYLTCATYDLRYTKYLKGHFRPSRRQKTFMTMNEFGPWNISRSSDIEDIASIILALTWKASSGN